MVLNPQTKSQFVEKMLSGFAPDGFQLLCELVFSGVANLYLLLL